MITAFLEMCHDIENIFRDLKHQEMLDKISDPDYEPTYDELKVIANMLDDKQETPHVS